jgi:nucleotide-binding universal stress UspA family protein
MFNRILVPTDFSPASDAALDYARILAAKFGASLQLLHVIDDPSASTFLAQARERLARTISATDRARLHATSEAFVGTPAPAIVDYATATGTGLIVMGTHGRTGLAHLLMGSVAEQVVRTAPCPVLTVRQAGVVDEAGVPVLAGRPLIPA